MPSHFVIDFRDAAVFFSLCVECSSTSSVWNEEDARWRHREDVVVAVAVVIEHRTSTTKRSFKREGV